MNLARSTPSHSEFADEDVRDIVIRSYSVIGQINGIGQSLAQVEAREAIVPDRHLADYSVRVELSSGGDYPQGAIAAIPYTELDRLISALRKLELPTYQRIDLISQKFNMKLVILK